MCLFPLCCYDVSVLVFRTSASFEMPSGNPCTVPPGRPLVFVQ